MVTYFNKKDLVSFGNYLLSDQRKERLEQHPMSTAENIEDRKGSVHHADVENWKESTNKK